MITKKLFLSTLLFSIFSTVTQCAETSRASLALKCTLAGVAAGAGITYWATSGMRDTLSESALAAASGTTLKATQEAVRAGQAPILEQLAKLQATATATKSELGAIKRNANNQEVDEDRNTCSNCFENRRALLQGFCDRDHPDYRLCLPCLELIDDCPLCRVPLREQRSYQAIQGFVLKKFSAKASGSSEKCVVM